MSSVHDVRHQPELPPRGGRGLSVGCEEPRISEHLDVWSSDVSSGEVSPECENTSTVEPPRLVAHEARAPDHSSVCLRHHLKDAPDHHKLGSVGGCMDRDDGGSLQEPRGQCITKVGVVVPPVGRGYMSAGIRALVRDCGLEAAYRPGTSLSSSAHADRGLPPLGHSWMLAVRGNSRVALNQPTARRPYSHSPASAKTPWWHRRHSRLATSIVSPPRERARLVRAGGPDVLSARYGLLLGHEPDDGVVGYAMAAS